MIVNSWIILGLFSLCYSTDIPAAETTPKPMAKLKGTNSSGKSPGELCYNVDGELVISGEHFVPLEDSCFHCRCENGTAQTCVQTACAKPTCQEYVKVAGKCCEYNCISDGSVLSTAEAAIIITLGVGLLLLLIILVYVVYRNRKRAIRDRHARETPRRCQNNLQERQGRSLNNSNVNRNNSNANRMNNRQNPVEEINFDSPPPYTPVWTTIDLKGETIESVPNEPPPPYERGESRV